MRWKTLLDHFAIVSRQGRLAEGLKHYANRTDVVVLALPRGGLPIGVEVAAALRAPLDVFVVRKLGVPQQPELAMGAIASGGVRVLNDDVARMLNLTDDAIDRVAQSGSCQRH
jgi:putative phosphoribosyl transferase